MATVEHLAVLENCDIARSRAMNEPSYIAGVPCESLTRNGLDNLSVEGDKGLVAHFHHYVGEDFSCYTRIELDDLRREWFLGDIVYKWNDRCAPWLQQPTSQCFAVAVKSSCLAFVTTELILGFIDLPWTQKSKLRYYDLQGHVGKDAEFVTVAIAVLGQYIWVLLAAKHGASTMVVLNTANHYLDVYDTNSMRFDVPITLGQPVFAVTPEHYYFGFTYCNSLGTHLFETGCLARGENNVIFASPLNKFEGLVPMNVVGIDLQLGCTIIECRKSYGSSRLTLTTFDKIYGTLVTWKQLAISFAQPFLSSADFNRPQFPTLSARMSAPWAIPLALIQVVLFLIFIPFMLIPTRKIYVATYFDQGNLFHTHLYTQWSFDMQNLNEEPIPGVYLPKYIQSFRKSDANIEFHCFTPTVRSRQTYAQCKSLRDISVLVYFLCLTSFAIATFYVLSSPAARFDLITCIALADAVAIYCLVLCQDIVRIVPLVCSVVKSAVWSVRAHLDFVVLKARSTAKYS